MMTRHDGSLLTLLLLLGAAACGSSSSAVTTGPGGGGGSGQGGGEAGSGAGVKPDGCVDINVSPQVLGEPDRWRDWGVPLRQGVWLQDGRVHVAWQADEILGEDPTWGTILHPWLVISIFDGEDGALVEHKLVDAIPVSPLSPNETADGYSLAAPGPDGAYLVKYQWRDADKVTHDQILVGNVEQEDFVVTDVPTNSLCHGAWDGESFALHGFAGGMSGFDLLVSRVDLDGSILMPFTAFGTTPNGCYLDLGYKTQTVPETGITYVFDASDQNYLSGHLRDGTPLPGTENGPLVIEPNGFNITNTSTPSLGATTDGLWVAWKQADAVQTSKVLAQWLTADGTPEGPAFELRGEVEGIEGLPRLHAVLGRPGGAGFFAGYLSAYLFGRDHDGQLLGDPIVAYEDQTATGAIPVKEVRLLEDDDGIPWIYWNEQKDDGPSQRRVMKLAPGCVYDALM